MTWQPTGLLWGRSALLAEEVPRSNRVAALGNGTVSRPSSQQKLSSKAAAADDDVRSARTLGSPAALSRSVPSAVLYDGQATVQHVDAIDADGWHNQGQDRPALFSFSHLAMLAHGLESRSADTSVLALRCGRS